MLTHTHHHLFIFHIQSLPMLHQHQQGIYIYTNKTVSYYCDAAFYIFIAITAKNKKSIVSQGILF